MSTSKPQDHAGRLLVMADAAEIDGRLREAERGKTMVGQEKGPRCPGAKELVAMMRSRKP